VTGKMDHAPLSTREKRNERFETGFISSHKEGLGIQSLHKDLPFAPLHASPSLGLSNAFLVVTVRETQTRKTRPGVSSVKFRKKPSQAEASEKKPLLEEKKMGGEISWGGTKGDGEKTTY